LVLEEDKQGKHVIESEMSWRIFPFVYRSMKWVLSVGENFITIFVVDTSHMDISVRQHYFVYIIREDLPSSDEQFKPSGDYQMCSLKQVDL
jgi:hypothetical protein